MKRKLIIMGMVVSLCISMNSGIKVQADDTNEAEYETIYRTPSGDLEELKGICIPKEQLPEQRVKGTAQIALQADGIDEDVQGFLSCGSDYGYRDMTKRSNTEGRQVLYEMIDEAAAQATLDGEDAYVEELEDGESFGIVAEIDGLEEYHFTEEELLETYFTFRNDNPQYFWLSNVVLYASDYSYVGIVTYDQYISGETRLQTMQEIMNTGEEVYLSKIQDTDDTYQKVRKIHDNLIQDIEYDYDHMNDIGPAHSIAGAMTSGKEAVCEGYAKVMQLMMNYYGINNIYVTGEGNGGGHAWNMVGMNDGKYYWLDATWDDAGTDPRYDYFLVGNQKFTDHLADTPTPDPDDPTAAFLYELPSASDTDYVYAPSEVTIIKGDINADGVINISDLMLSLNHVSQKSLLKGNALLAADIDEDGNVTIKDLMRILNYVSGKSAAL